MVLACGAEGHRAAALFWGHALGPSCPALTLFLLSFRGGVGAVLNETVFSLTAWGRFCWNPFSARTTRRGSRVLPLT
jgi:ABC-type dipeptide/oligopeptide/nickel transport system permease component